MNNINNNNTNNIENIDEEKSYEESISKENIDRKLDNNIE